VKSLVKNKVGGLILSITLLAACGLVPLAKADTMVLCSGSNGYTGLVSAVVGSAGPSGAWNYQNPTTDATFRFGWSGASGYNLAGLFQFNDSNGTGIGTIKSSPTSITTIGDASLTLRVNQASSPAGSFTVALITDPWNPQNLPASGSLALPAYDTTSAITYSWSSQMANSTFFSINVTSLVQKMVDSTTDYYGFIIFGNDNQSYIGKIDNGFSSADRVPKLSLNYTISAIPEPSTYALLLVGFGTVVGLRWYRRRVS
jgi:hypothetical protein